MEMKVFSGLWWVWGSGFLLAFFYISFNQIQRMKRLTHGDGDIFKGFIPLIISLLLVIAFGTMFVISIIAMLIELAKG